MCVLLSSDDETDAKGEDPTPDLQLENLSRPNPPERSESVRNLTGFWLLGLFNNFAYVIMLSAAHDILHKDFNNQTVSQPEPDILNQTGQPDLPNNTGRYCNPTSTGAILLADIIPAIFIKSIAAFLPISVHIKVAITAVLSASSFLFVSFSTNTAMAFIGVIFASLSSGLGEATFLSFSHLFHPNTISSWSSGTGGSGVLGAGSYAALTSLGVSPRTTVLVMVIIPVGMAATFWLILQPPESSNEAYSDTVPLLASDTADIIINRPTPHPPVVTFTDKMAIFLGLYKYMVPLGLVYFFEYLINQGLYELLYYPNPWLTQPQQYRWLQLDYQLGVLVSRSSVNLIQIPNICLLALLQAAMLGLFLAQAITWFLPAGIILLFPLVFTEGLLGGAAYVNTFYRISREVKKEEKEFSLGIACLADSTAIGFAGAAALPLHDYICAMAPP